VDSFFNGNDNRVMFLATIPAKRGMQLDLMSCSMMAETAGSQTQSKNAEGARVIEAVISSLQSILQTLLRNPHSCSRSLAFLSMVGRQSNERALINYHPATSPRSPA
jgi:hypothetical protein